MNGTVWVLEFTCTTIGAAQDIVRQHTPAAEMVPGVEQSGRLGYEVADVDYELISAVKAHVEAEGGKTILGKR